MSSLGVSDIVLQLFEARDAVKHPTLNKTASLPPPTKNHPAENVNNTTVEKS